MKDDDVIKHIEKLVEEEERLYTKGNLSDEETASLKQMKIKLDQYWDLLRQRQALKDAGKNPDEAKLRPPGIVENYEQ
jgi:hypothetical protein